MALSFGCDQDQANELVQEMYLRLYKYVDNPEKITYKQDEVNTFYVYVTLRNLYLSKKHLYTQPNHREYNKTDAPVVDPYYNPLDHEFAFKSLIERITAIVDGWYWYDKKLWNIHFFQELSMRAISRETTISLSSIFNTLKNGKTKIKQKAEEDYREYLDSKETG